MFTILVTPTKTGLLSLSVVCSVLTGQHRYVLSATIVSKHRLVLFLLKDRELLQILHLKVVAVIKEVIHHQQDQIIS